MLSNQSLLNFVIEYWYIGVVLILSLIYKLFKAKIKGRIGEISTALILRSLNRSNYKVINNVVLNRDNKTSQIDHIVISSFGVFVIETKNQKGWILGGEYSEYWTQVIYKRKEKFYNPILQNQGHIFALRHCLIEFPNVRYIPIVVFSNNATLKVKVISEVVYTTKLIKAIRGYSEVVLAESDKEAILKKITSANVKDSYKPSQHVASIKRKLKTREELLEQNKCPRCENNLVIRKGKFGDFKGCSNFPSCKFTIND